MIQQLCHCRVVWILMRREIDSINSINTLALNQSEKRKSVDHCVMVMVLSSMTRFDRQNHNDQRLCVKLFWQTNNRFAVWRAFAWRQCTQLTFGWCSFDARIDMQSTFIGGVAINVNNNGSRWYEHFFLSASPDTIRRHNCHNKIGWIEISLC